MLSGCNNADPVIQQTSLKDSRVISFQPVIDKPQKAGTLQRAAVATANTITQFNVAAWSGNTENAILGYAYGPLYTTLVSRNQVSGQWTYPNPVEWPESGTVTFYAIANITESARFNQVGDSYSDRNMFIYHSSTDEPGGVSTDPSKHADVLFAVKEDVPVPPLTGGGNTPVQLTFHHALARVRVQVRNVNPADSIRIDSVKLVNLYRKGDFIFNAANLPDGPMTYASEPDPKWTNHSAMRNFAAAVVTGGVLIPNQTYVSVVGDSAGAGKSDNSIMVMPQTTNIGESSTDTDPDLGTTGTEKFYLYIQAQSVDGEGNATADPSTKYWIAVPHPGKATGIVFEPGREYTFQVTLNANRIIYFDRVQIVNGWDRTAGANTDGNLGAQPEP